MTKWQPESIPDQDRPFMRVHVKTWVRDGEVRPGAFQNRPEGAPGMSTDWERYSSAEETRQRARKPLEQGVIAFRAGAARALPGQVVQHTPQDDNRAHTDVFGEKDEEVRLKFTRIYKWASVPAT
jgi:hypothetical protein